MVYVFFDQEEKERKEDEVQWIWRHWICYKEGQMVIDAWKIVTNEFNLHAMKHHIFFLGKIEFIKRVNMKYSKLWYMLPHNSPSLLINKKIKAKKNSHLSLSFLPYHTNSEEYILEFFQKYIYIYMVIKYMS